MNNIQSDQSSPINDQSLQGNDNNAVRKQVKLSNLRKKFRTKKQAMDFFLLKSKLEGLKIKK